VAWAKVYFRTKWYLHPSSLWPQQTCTGPKTGGLCPFEGGGATPSNTTSPGPRFTSVPSGILIHPAVWPQKTWAKNWVGVVCLFFLGVAGSPSNTKSPEPRPTSIPNGILSIQPYGHNGHRPKIVVEAVPLQGRGRHLTQCRVNRGLPPYQVAS